MQANMKTWYRLTAWYWSMVQKRFLLVAVFMTVAETALVLVTAARHDALGITYENLFLSSASIPVFVAGYVATMSISLRPTLLAQGKTRASYTLATLPNGGACALFAQIACTALPLLLLIAWQILLMLVLYFAAVPINAAVTMKYLPQYVMPVADMQLSFVRNMLFRKLVPTGLPGIAMLLMIVVAPSAMLAGTLFQRGVARLGSLVLGLGGAYCCAVLLMQAPNFFPMWPDLNPIFEVLPWVALPVLTAISVVWSMRSVRRGKWV